MSEDAGAREELLSALEARRELGSEYEADIVESFLARVDRQVAARVDAKLAVRQPAPKRDRFPYLYSLVTMGLAIPLTAVSADYAGLQGIAVTWGGIAIVNAVAAVSGRRERGR